jgi:hypothetical protein
MARSRKRKPKAPRFPRNKWLPGQKPRVEKPKKGPGSYDRLAERQAVRREKESE